MVYLLKFENSGKPLVRFTDILTAFQSLISVNSPAKLYFKPHHKDAILLAWKEG